MDVVHLVCVRVIVEVLTYRGVSILAGVGAVDTCTIAMRVAR